MENAVKQPCCVYAVVPIDVFYAEFFLCLRGYEIHGIEMGYHKVVAFEVPVKSHFFPVEEEEKPVHPLDERAFGHAQLNNLAAFWPYPGFQRHHQNFMALFCVLLCLLPCNPVYPAVVIECWG